MVGQVLFIRTSPLLFTLLAYTTTAAPSQLVRRDLSQQSTCFDLETYQGSNGGWLTSDMWGMTDASGYLRDWWGFHNGDTNFAADFAQPWGMGQSFSCRFATPCAKPDCQSMQNPGGAEAAPAYQILLSLSNLNNFLVAARQSLEQAQSRWAGIQVAIQQKFWPNVPADDLALKQGLGALNAIMGMAMAVAGGPLPGASAALVDGLVGAATNALTDSDKSLDYLAKMEMAAADWYNKAMGTINTLNDDLMSVGHHQFPDGSIADVQPLLQDGVWSDYRNIPVLNTDASKPRVSTSDLNQLFYNLLLGQVVNYAWKQQAVWIVKFDMTQEQFDNFVSPYGSNDHRLKLYYGGSAFFFQGLSQQPSRVPSSALPPGWGDLEGVFNGAVNSQDVLRSSADAWHDSGFGNNFNVDSAGASDPASLMSLGPKARGFWNIPVCVPPTDKVFDLDSLASWLDVQGKYFSDLDVTVSSWCICEGTTDSSGRVFRDQFPSSWTDAMSPNCNAHPNYGAAVGV